MRPKRKRAVIEEPIPAKQFCGACHDSYLCYYTHISTLQHRQNYHGNAFLNEIDGLIGELDRKHALTARSAMETPDSILTKTSIQLDYFTSRMKEM